MPRVLRFYFFKTIDLLFIFENGEGGDHLIGYFCGRHKGMTTYRSFEVSKYLIKEKHIFKI